MSRHSWTPFLALTFFAAFFPATSDAEMRAYGLQNLKTPEARQVGISHYSLFHDQEAGLSRAEAFDAQGESLLACEALWKEDSRSFTCTFPNGHPYRLSWADGGERKFEDLVTGDYVVVRFELDEAIDEKPTTTAPGEAPAPPQGRYLQDGTKSRQEAEAEWGSVLPLMGNLFAEVILTLGFEATHTSPAARSDPSTPQPVLLCDHGELAFCDTNQHTSVFVSITGNATQCCASASLRADGQCRLYSGLPCCANSLCSVGCYLFVFCDCSLAGYFWSCPPPCG